MRITEQGDMDFEAPERRSHIRIMTENIHCTKDNGKTNQAYPDDVEYLTIGEREIYLVGTAHVSQGSVDLVKQVIANEKPDYV